MDEKPRSTATTLAKWGAACSACATAKAKCLRSNETPGSKCDRCERLSKSCVAQVHRPRKKRQSKPSKTAQLEERLNSLVDLLKASNASPESLQQSLHNTQNTSNATDSTGRGGSSSISEPAPLAQQRHHHHESLSNTNSIHASNVPHIPHAPSIASPSSPYVPQLPQTVPPTWNENAPARCICRVTVGEVAAPLDSDEALLLAFMTKMTTYYPFVVLPPGTTAQQLQSTKPLLLSAIKMVASVRHLRSMRAQSYPIMKHISEYMLLRSERSLELLQTILLLLGWYHYHCMMHAQMSNLTALAYSLLTDLRLNRPPEVNQERAQILAMNPSQPGERTNDEKRALCGVWYMTSVVSLAFQKMDQPRYTPYIDRCVRELETAGEYDSDLVLGQLVRIQHLSDRISQLHAKDRMDDELPGIPRAPVNAYLNVFQAELDKYEAQIPAHLKSNKIVMLHLRTATLRLWEPPILDVKLLESLHNTLTSMSLGSPSTLDMLYRSNAALKDWFDSWLSIDVTEYFYMSMPACAQLIVAITMLARWAKLCNAEPATLFPASSSRQNIYNPDLAGIPMAMATLKTQIMAQKDLQMDIGGVLQALVSRLEEAKTTAHSLQGDVWDNNLWDLAAKKISIARVKLERWAEIISTAGVEGLLTRREEGSGGGGGACDDESSVGVAAASTAAPVPMVVDMAMSPAAHGEWQCGTGGYNVFAQGIFDGLGLDQDFFYDDGAEIPGFGSIRL